MNRHSIVFPESNPPSALLREVIDVAMSDGVDSVLLLTNYPLLPLDERGCHVAFQQGPSQAPRLLSDVLALARELLGDRMGEAVSSERRDFQVSVSIPGLTRLSVFAQVSRSMPTLSIRAAREFQLEAAWAPLREEAVLQELCRGFTREPGVTVLCAPRQHQAYQLALGVGAWLAHNRDNMMMVSLEEGLRSFVRHTPRNPVIQREIGFDVESVSDALNHLERVEVGGLVCVPDAAFLSAEEAKRLTRLNAPVILGMRCNDSIAAASVFTRLGADATHGRIYFYSDSQGDQRAQRVQQHR